ncbi:MAG: thiamine pyrophosphate-binding protein [Proteobacteria bacterium]|nr:thiamine pyrophosphate-binding protein [Pseudomonadota bacterium]
MVKVSDVLVDFITKQGIEVVFGVVGSANSYIYNSLDQCGEVKLVATHHEQAAVMAMGAYYRATGKLAAALVTAGGGASNAFTGILSNWADSVPGIVIAGQEQSYYVEAYEGMRMYGVQGFDSVDTYKNYTKLSVRLTKDNLQESLVDAMQVVKDDRPGPVYLEVPFDVQSQLVEPITFNTPSTVPNTLTQEALLIVDKLTKAERPLVLGGHGVKLAQAEELFCKFVETNNIPSVLSWSAVDLLPTDHPNNFGRPGVQGQRAANFIVQNSDLIIVLGSRLSLLQTGYSRKDFAPNAEIIHVDIDPKETQKFNGINLNVDVKNLLLELTKINPGERLSIQSWIKYCERLRAEYPIVMPEHLSDPTNSYTFIDKLSKAWPDHYTIVTDMGTALLSGFYGFNIKPNQKMFTSLGLGEMGYGLAAAVGAGFGINPVLCLNCDGGMMMNLQELQTIVTHNLPVKIVIFNNDGYLMIKHTQKMLFNGHRTCVDAKTGVTLPDYQKVSQAFGLPYFTESSMDEFIAHEGYAVMEVFMDPNQEFIPKVRGIKQQDGTIIAGVLEEMSPLLPFENVEKAMIMGVSEQSKQAQR